MCIRDRWNEAAPLAQWPHKLTGPGLENPVNGWTPTSANQAKQNELEIKRLVKQGMMKEDFEVALNQLKNDVCSEWKANCEQRKVFALAIKTFGVNLDWKSRRKALMKLLALLCARRERSAATVTLGTGGGAAPSGVQPTPGDAQMTPPGSS